MKTRKLSLIIDHLNQKQWEFIMATLERRDIGPVEASASEIRWSDNEIEVGYLQLSGTGQGAAAILNHFCPALDATCKTLTFELDSLPLAAFKELLAVAGTVSDPEMVGIDCDRMAFQQKPPTAEGITITLSGAGIDEREAVLRPLLAIEFA